jgi:hypothetical protein
MECLSRLVGIKNTCDTPVSHSDYWLDDIDITISEVEKYVEKDQLSATKFVESKINFAARSVADTVNRNFLSKYEATTMLTNGRVGYEQENKTVVATTGNRKGIILEVCSLQSHTKFYISKLSLYTDFTGDIDVEIYDVTQGKLLDTITVTCVADQISYANVNKSYSSNQKRLKLAFLYDTTGVNSYQTYLSNSGCFDCAGGYGTMRVSNYVNAQSVSIPLATDEIDENFTNISETGGMAVHFNLSCDNENWLCDIGNVVALPILYKAGADILRYGMDATMRFNSRAGNDDARMQKRIDFLELQYREAMDNILPQIQIPSDPICFKCNDRIKTKITLP